MNVISRGIKNAFRSPLRSGSVVLMLAISIGLILSMLVARSSINTKISSIESSVGTTVTISAAGSHGGFGSSTLLTSANLNTIKTSAHVSSTTSTLSKQMSSTDTNLAAALTMGGPRSAEQSSTDSNSSSDTAVTATATTTTTSSPIIVTGTTNPNSVSTDGSDLTISSGKTIDGSSSNLVALVGTELATKNSLTTGSTFTAYGKTITVSGIYKTGNKFEDSGLILPLTAVQTLTSETGVTGVTAIVDSSANVDSTVTSLKSALGTSIDITSQKAQAEASVSSLEGIASLALAGVIGASAAGACIVLLSMVMIVRERRREIGVIKAIGGSDFKVIVQFMSEALSLTFVGAIVGLGLGIAVSGPMTSSLVSSSSSSSTETSSSPMGGKSDAPSGGPSGMMRSGMKQIGENFTSVTSSLTPETFAIAVGITILIAIIGSAVPAWFISKVRPSEVLRSE